MACGRREGDRRTIHQRWGLAAKLLFFLIGVLSIVLFVFSASQGIGKLLRGLGYLAFSPYLYALSARKNLEDSLAFMDVAWPWKLAGYTGIMLLVADLAIQAVDGQSPTVHTNLPPTGYASGWWLNSSVEPIMESMINKQFGNITIAAGLLVAVLGLVMWNTIGHISGIGFVVAGTGFNLKSRSLPKRGSSQTRPRNIGIAFFVLGLCVLVIELAGF